MKSIYLNICLLTLLPISVFQGSNAEGPPSGGPHIVTLAAPIDPTLGGKSGMISSSDVQPVSPVVVVPPKKKPSPSAGSLTPDAQAVMAQFKQDLARKTAPKSVLAFPPAIVRPLPVPTSPALSFQQLLTKLGGLRKIADKQLGFFSGRLFSKSKKAREVTGSDCQNAYMTARNSFDKMKKTYNLGTLTSGDVVPGLSSNQASSINSVVQNCLSACTVGDGHNKQTKYKNYHNFCTAQKKIVDYMVLSHIAEGNLLPAIKTINTVAPGTPSVDAIYHGSSQGKQCVTSYNQVVNMAGSIDKQKLISSTIGCLNNCNPKNPGFSDSAKFALLVRAKAIKEKRDNDQTFEEKKLALQAKLDAVLKILNIQESQLQDEYNKLKPLFEQLQTMNRACWFGFQEKAIPMMLTIYPNMKPTSIALDAAAVILLVHDGKMYYQDNDGYLYYQEVSLSDEGLNSEGKKTFPEATYGDKIPSLKLKIEGIDANRNRSKMGK